MGKTRDQLYEELLALRAQHGDATAFADLVDRFQPRLWRHAYQLLGDEDAAWEVLQEGWLAMVKGLPSLKEAGAFPRWAYRIVAHKAADLIRRRARHESAVRQLAREHEATAIARPSGGGMLDVALRELPEASRALLSLRYGGDMSITEIAEVLDLPEGTVKSRLHRAREKLQRLLEADGDE